MTQINRPASAANQSPAALAGRACGVEAAGIYSPTLYVRQHFGSAITELFLIEASLYTCKDRTTNDRADFGRHECIGFTDQISTVDGQICAGC
jgi:hypothetical protein